MFGAPASSDFAEQPRVYTSQQTLAIHQEKANKSRGQQQTSAVRTAVPRTVPAEVPSKWKVLSVAHSCHDASAANDERNDYSDPEFCDPISLTSVKDGYYCYTVSDIAYLVLVVPVRQV